MVDVWIKNLNGGISETKSELGSPLKAISYDRQSANATETNLLVCTILWENSPYRQAYIMLD